MGLRVSRFEKRTISGTPLMDDISIEEASLQNERATRRILWSNKANIFVHNVSKNSHTARTHKKVGGAAKIEKRHASGEKQEPWLQKAR